MTCTEVTTWLIERDNHVEMPAEVREHLQRCPECTRQATLLVDSIDRLQRVVRETTPDEIEDRIMAAVRSEAARSLSEAEAPPVALRGWIVAGTLLVGGSLALRFSRWMEWLRESFGPSVDVATSLVLGVAVTSYICLLVVSNFDRLSDRAGGQSPQ